jgi:ABC-2 type transport system ATP-binding protein
VLRIEGLKKSYGDIVALRGVDVEVRPGEIVSLLGPNGAGKTTLVSIVAGLRRPDSGSVTVAGLDALAQPRAARRLIGLAPQDLGIYPIVTVRQNLELFGELSGLRGRQLAARVDDVAQGLRIEDLLSRPAGELSGGQKRRLHTAIALLHRPKLLLLDEATAGADVETRGHLLDLVRELAAEGSAVLYSTHYLHEVESLSAYVVLLEQGAVIARGTVRDLVAAHGHAAVEFRFDGEAPTLPSGSLDGRTERHGDILRIATGDPGTALAEAIPALGTETRRLRAVHIVPADLEAVYLSLTGRRYDAGEEMADVAAS